MKAKLISFLRANYLLLIVMIVGLGLRFYNLAWDSGFPTHPDERDIVIAASRIKFFSELDPKFFTYGGLPIYLVAAGANLLGWGGNLYRIHLISRALSALASVGAVLLIYLVARKLFDKKVAITSAILAALSPGFIQYAHFGVADSLVIFFLLVIFYFSLDFLKKGSLKLAALTGVVLGLAVGTKLQSIIFASIPGMTLFCADRKKITLTKAFKYLFIIFAVGAISFILINPLLIAERSLFLKEVGLASAIATGNQIVHFTLQFMDANFFTFSVKNIFWLAGPASAFGLLFFAWFFFSRMKKDRRLLIFVLFPVLYFVYVNTWHVKFVRYMLPVVPFVIIAASALLTELRKRNGVWGNIFLSLTLAATIFYGLSFFNLYRTPMSTYMASEWIYANVPGAAKILTEALDLKLPLAIIKAPQKSYSVIQLAMYEPDSKEKTELLAESLAASDYLVFSSPRFWGNIPKDPQNYPVSTKYYSMIFDGSLGYQKAAEFNKYPSFLGIAIKDDSAEETFKVFEHPRVLIFKNEKRLSLKNITNILLESSR